MFSSTLQYLKSRSNVFMAGNLFEQRLWKYQSHVVSGNLAYLRIPFWNLTWSIGFLWTKVIQQLQFMEHLLCSIEHITRVVLKALHVLISTLTSWDWYHHYSHVTEEENEVYKSSVTCPESYSQWEVKSGFEFASITCCQYCGLLWAREASATQAGFKFIFKIISIWLSWYFSLSSFLQVHTTWRLFV